METITNSEGHRRAKKWYFPSFNCESIEPCCTCFYIHICFSETVFVYSFNVSIDLFTLILFSIYIKLVSTSIYFLICKLVYFCMPMWLLVASPSNQLLQWTPMIRHASMTTSVSSGSICLFERKVSSPFLYIFCSCIMQKLSIYNLFILTIMLSTAVEKRLYKKNIHIFTITRLQPRDSNATK